MSQAAAKPVRDSFVVTNNVGRSFFVRLVFAGERYGLNDCLVHDGELGPMIEFYDQTYAGKKTFGPRGQFVSSYYAQTLATHGRGMGITLDGGVPEWRIDGAALAPVIEMAKALGKGCGHSDCARVPGMARLCAGIAPPIVAGGVGFRDGSEDDAPAEDDDTLVGHADACR